jgi:TPR repeat protein
LASVSIRLALRDLIQYSSTKPPALRAISLHITLMGRAAQSGHREGVDLFNEGPWNKGMRSGVKLLGALALSFILALGISAASADTEDDADSAFTRGDYATALKLFEQLSEAGDAGATYALGKMYYEGDGTKSDLPTAAEYFTAAANKGHALAQIELGRMYLTAEGVNLDYEASFHWYQLAANQGNPHAQVMLGNLYHSGQGVDYDAKLSAHWYELAAKQGDPDGQYMMGYLYRDGDGVPRDYAASTTSFKLAADSGDSRAELELGKLFRDGVGVEKDLVQAHMWFTLCARNAEWGASEYQEAVTARGKVEKKMSADQISRAQQLAAHWKPVKASGN